MDDKTMSQTRARRVVLWLRKEALPLAVLMLLMMAARSSFANHYYVPSGSMENTLFPGDKVFVDMSAYGLRLPFSDIRVLPRDEPRPGDIAVFDSPHDGTRLIKRVVAVGGDRVDLVEGRLYLNGVALRKGERADTEAFGEHVAVLNLDAGGGPDVHGLVVPEGKVLVVGDHRGNSFDGRYFGWVDADALYGRAVAVYYRKGEGLGWREL